MTVSGKDRRGFVEEIRTLRTRLDRLERRTAELRQANEALQDQITERLKADRQIREQAKIIDLTTDSIIKTDLRGIVTMWNRGAEQVFGYTAQEMVGKPVGTLYPPQEQGKLAEIIETLSRGEEISMVDVTCVRKDGSFVELALSLLPLKDGAGNVIDFVGISKDITERKRSEEALREREEMIRALVETSRDWIWSIDVHGVHTFCNPAVEQILGYSADELIGRQSLDLIHDDDRRMVEANLPTWIAEKRGWSNLMLRWRHKDGTYRYLESNAVPIWSSENKLVGFRGVDRDVTERRQAEKALQETTALLETIFDHTHILVACLDPQFHFVRVNHAYAQADGREPSFFVGRNHFDLYPNAENEAIFRKVVETGVPYSAHAKSFEYAGHPERGVTYWDWSLVPIKQQDGGVCGLVLTLANVTEQKRAEQALRESEGHYHSLAKLSPAGIFRTNVEGDYTYVNERWCEIAGMSPEESLGQGWVRAAHPDDRERARDEWYQGVRKQKPFRMEYRFRRPDGTVTCVQGRATAEKDIDGHIVGYVGTISNITELKRAQDALAASETKYRSLFDNSIEGIGLSKGNRVISANKALLDIFGYDSVEEFTKIPLLDHVAPESRAVIRELMQNAEKGLAEPFSRLEYAVLRKDGQIRTLEISRATVFIEGERFSQSTFRDITERRKAEEALRESEEKFRSLAEQSPNMIFINKQGRIVYANKKCEHVMGYAREELYRPDFDFRRLIAPESLDLIQEKFARHLRGEEVEPYDYCLINRAGDRIEAIIASKLIQYEGKTAILGIVTDITERKKAEQALRESQERLKILFESAPDAFYVMDVEGRFVDGNKTAEEMIGFTKAELIGKSLAESRLLSAGDLSKAAANLRKTAAGRPSGPTEYTVRRKNGSLVAVEIRTFPVRIGGKILSLGIARDITERKRAQQRLLDDRKQLKSLASQLSLTEERERRRLATVLHDHIGQSLVFSKIKLDQMCKYGSTVELTEALKDVSRCLERVIQDTRTLTFDLSNPILYELGFEAAVAEWLTEQVQQKHGIEAEFQDDGQVKPLDDDIQALLFRNVRELLTNVVKHARAQRVKVSVGKTNKCICVSVQDDGIGFDPVEVAATAAKRAEFGLFSIRERLEQLGGRIEIESKPGWGTRITMTAPLKYEQANEGT